MDVKTFIKHVEKYLEYEIVSDSEWECYETGIDAALISHKNKKIVLRQDINYDVSTYYDGSYEVLYDKNEKENKI